MFTIEDGDAFCREDATVFAATEVEAVEHCTYLAEGVGTNELWATRAR